MSNPEFYSKIEEQFKDSIKDSCLSDDMRTVVVDKTVIVEFCRFLKDDTHCRFDYLSDICGVDYHPVTPRFEVVYHLYSIPLRHRLRVKCRLDENETIESVTSVWSTANWHERETYDMFGIVFSAHPDLRRIYMWNEFEGYPLRKDFPTRGYKDDLNPFGSEKPEAPE